MNLLKQVNDFKLEIVIGQMICFYFHPCSSELSQLCSYLYHMCADEWKEDEYETHEFYNFIQKLFQRFQELLEENVLWLYKTMKRQNVKIVFFGFIYTRFLDFKSFSKNS